MVSEGRSRFVNRSSTRGASAVMELAACRYNVDMRNLTGSPGVRVRAIFSPSATTAS